MYEIFEKLIDEMGITAYRFCKDTGVSSSTISTWKKKNSICGTELAGIIANYFGKSIDYVLTGKMNSETQKTELTAKDERDISKALNETLSQLDSQDGLMFDGEALDDETKELLKISLENALRTAKVTAKRKFTPKKYRKDN